MSLTLKASNKCFDGEVRKYTFKSKVLGDLDANFNLFLPAAAVNGSKAVPLLYYLAGLTCTEDNGAQKGGFHERAAKEGIAVLYPDTSPRGAKIEGEDDSYDFGSGAGFYINATKAPWSKHYNMYDHIVKEIPEQLKQSDIPVVSARAGGARARARASVAPRGSLLTRMHAPPTTLRPTRTSKTSLSRATRWADTAP